MLFYLADNRLKDTTASLLAQVAPDTPLLLTADAVYLYEQISSRHSQLNVKILNEDAEIRGLPTQGKSTWTMADWSHQGAKFSPWIKL